MSGFDGDIHQQSSVGRATLKETSADSALQPEGVMPVQFYGARRREGAQTEAVKRLMCAILEDALRCFERNLGARTAVRRREFCEVKDWFFKGTGKSPFSFENVCDTLGVDPKRLRRVISARRTNILAGATPTPLSRRLPVMREANRSALFSGRSLRARRTSDPGK